MNRFSEWLKYHQSIFPNVGKWIADLADPRAQVESWKKVLSGCDFDNCVEASNLIKAGEFDKPMAHEDWPKEIRKISRIVASEKRLLATTTPRKVISGHITHSCRDCLDEGMVLVVHLDSYEVARRDGLDAILKSMIVPCNCSHGLPHREQRVCINGKATDKFYHYYEFNSNFFFPWRGLEREVLGVDWKMPTSAILKMAREGQFEVKVSIQPFLDWLAGFDQRKLEARPNYVEAFADF